MTLAEDRETHCQNVRPISDAKTREYFVFEIVFTRKNCTHTSNLNMALSFRFLSPSISWQMVTSLYESIVACTLTLSLSHSLTHTHTFSYYLSLSFLLSLSHFFSLSLSCFFITLSPSPSLSLYSSHFSSIPHSLSLTISHSHTLTHPLSIFQCLSITHQSLSVFLLLLLFYSVISFSLSVSITL